MILSIKIKQLSNMFFISFNTENLKKLLKWIEIIKLSSIKVVQMQIISPLDLEKNSKEIWSLQNIIKIFKY